MNYRNLGNTGLKISEIGLGTEYLYSQPKQIVVSVIQEAISNGINFFDIVFNVPQYIKNISAAIKDFKNDVILTCHIGSIEHEGNVKRSRSVKACERTILNTLNLLGKDTIEIVNLQYVKDKEYQEIISSRGLLNLAFRLREEGKIRFISISTHDFSVALKALKSDYFDSILVPINFANHSLEERNKVLQDCGKGNKGLVAIKPFAGGKLLQKNRTVTIAKYQSGGINLKKKIPGYITPVKCINYVLSHPTVSTTIPGVKNLEELTDIFSFMNATSNEKDYSILIEDFKN